MLQVSEISSAVDANGNKEDKYEIMLAVKELASKGMAAEVVEEINDMDPSFFAENHILLFQLKRVSEIYLVKSIPCHLNTGTGNKIDHNLNVYVNDC